MASLYEGLAESTTTRLYDHGVTQPDVRQAVLVTPIWQPTLDEESAALLRISQRTNAELPSVFLAPHTLDLGYYREAFPSTQVLTFEPQHFSSVASYSVWMTTPELYRALSGFNWMVLCQTDAVLVRSVRDLLGDLDQSPDPYDYLGARWSPPVRVLAFGNRLVVDSPTAQPRGPWFARLFGRRLNVGNGGLSLRRIVQFEEVAARITKELPRRIIEHCYEDVIYCTYGPARGLRVASVAQAQAVFTETEVIGRTALPDTYGFHALARWNPLLVQELLKQFADE